MPLFSLIMVAQPAARDAGTAGFSAPEAPDAAYSYTNNVSVQHT